MARQINSCMYSKVTRATAMQSNALSMHNLDVVFEMRGQRVRERRVRTGASG